MVKAQAVNGRGHQSNGLDELTTVLTFIDSRLRILCISSLAIVSNNNMLQSLYNKGNRAVENEFVCPKSRVDMSFRCKVGGPVFI